MFESIHNKQKILLGSTVIVACFCTGLLFCMIFSDDKEDALSLKPNVVLGPDRIDPKEVWVHNLQNENKLLNQKIDTLEVMMKKIIENIDNQKYLLEKEPVQINDDSKNSSNDTSIIRNTLKETFNEKEKTFPSFPPSESQEFSKSSYGISKISLKIIQKKKLKTIDTHVPAGSFARVVLLGGVDASTSIQSSGEPRPVLLKICDFGTLPRSFRSDLKDCHVIGAAYGDIASERVYMRLEKFSAVERLSGEIIEIPIKGYVAGEDGKTGMKGILIDRSNESMKNALIGGFLSGIGGFFSQAKNPIAFTPTAPFGQASPLSATQMLQESSSKGLSNAFEKYADFYIKRAEQMQPVLEVEAGRVMDIVITEGFDMSESAYKKKLSTQRDAERLDNIEKIHSHYESIA